MWTLPMQEIKFVTVEQMYKFAQPNTALLSTYNAEFWQEYIANHQRYDRIFARLYKNFYYFNQDANLTPAVVTPEFIEDVYGLLLMNTKRYSELYRIHVVDDTTYSILDNYDVTETRNSESDDTIYTSYDERKNTEQGSRNLTDRLGQRVSNVQNTIGSQNNTAVDKTAPYDSENFSNENRTETALGQRSDTSASTENAVNDSHDTYIDMTRTYGPYTTNRNRDLDESYTLHRKGNIGVQTQTEVMEKHERFWNGFNFYKIIFDDICKELLLIQKGYLD